MPRLLRRVLRGAAIVLIALVAGLVAGAVWTDLTQGDPGEGHPEVVVVSPSTGR